ncbi:hypothetical protein B0H13DRAFT_1903006 [Mycena leptocephala]|nr:hypothetical protein B0H13DRAFT_1903006 [Mycena leptocephala]
MITSAVNRLAHTGEREDPGRYLNAPDISTHRRKRRSEKVAQGTGFALNCNVKLVRTWRARPMITSVVNRLAHTGEREGPGRWLIAPDCGPKVEAWVINRRMPEGEHRRIIMEANVLFWATSIMTFTTQLITGSTKLLTDPQIMTAPSVFGLLVCSIGGRIEIFGDGNVPAAFNAFPEQYHCNGFCRWFELPR